VSELSPTVLIVGGGVVGVACAAALARHGHEIVIIERHARLGEETTSRNSGVVHAGLYYPPASKKALFCIERDIPHKKTGKLVLAVTDEETTSLELLAERAKQNGAGELRFMESSVLRAIEPELFATLALYSPESGIVDVHALVTDLAQEARAHGAVFAMRTTLVGLEPGAPFTAEIEDPNGRSVLHPRIVIDSAGLSADHVASLVGIDVDRAAIRIAPCKGEYFLLTHDAPRPSHALVYPVPRGAGLGIHLTTDLGGQVHAGPDATFVDVPTYDVDENKRALFAERVRTYLPRIQDEHLVPAYAGVRPKLRGGEGLGRDFVIEDAEALGVPGLILLAGIESPGLTAALAIAEHVATLVRSRLS
jgi:L-2-hydroxyglutarate oxidase LhgO